MAESDEDSGALKELFSRVRLEVSSTGKAWLFCFRCSTMVTVSHDDDVIGWALLHRAVLCTNCNEPIDPWWVLVEALKQPTLGVTVPIGLKQTWITYRLPTVGVKTLRLEQEGVAPSAQILHVAHSTIWADLADVVDLDATDSARRPAWSYRLACIWHGQEPPPADVQGSTMVVWADHDKDDLSRQQLVAALQELGNGRLKEAIIPASVAVEEPLARTVDAYFSWVGVNREDRKQLLRTPFASQLNALAPAIAKQFGIPPLPTHVSAALNELRKLRNSTAHAGTKDPERSVLAKCIAGAIYGFRYARLLEEAVAVVRSTEQKPEAG
jgi:hypothetical protein